MLKRIIIVDDEYAARLKLRQLISVMPDWRIVAELKSGDLFLQTLQEMTNEVVLLDINMPGLNGIEVLTYLNRAGFAGEVIFTTAHTRYAVDAFTGAAADYVLKPINASRLQLALERAEQKIRLKQHSKAQQELLSRVGQRTRTVKVESIDAIITNDGIQLAHCGEQVYPLDQSLRELEIELPEQFLRIHRGAIVNRFRLREVERWLNGRLLLRFINSNLEVITSRNGARYLKRHLNM